LRRDLLQPVARVPLERAPAVDAVPVVPVDPAAALLAVPPAVVAVVRDVVVVAAVGFLRSS
jgi:hypothetical protein